MSEAVWAIPLRAFEQSLPMALMRARESVMRSFRPLLAEHDLTEQQWRVLRALTDADGPIFVGQLAERTFLLGPSLSRMLVSLEERHLIERSAAADARRAEIRISEQGHRMVTEAAPAIEDAYGLIDSRLDDGDLDDLYRLLDKLATPEPGGHAS